MKILLLRRDSDLAETGSLHDGVVMSDSLAALTIAMLDFM